MALNLSGKSQRSTSGTSSGGSSGSSSGKVAKVQPAGQTPWPALIPLGHHAGKPPIPLMRPVTLIGSRHNAHLHLLSRQISKAHALLISHEGKVYIRDLASRTHVYVNGQQVREADLIDGDMIKLGSFTFQFQAAAGMKQKARPDDTAAGQLAVQGADFPLVIDQRVMLIGRRPSCDISLVEDTCSTAHAVIFSMGGRRYVRDLGSRTGTYVNGQAVRQQELQFGDTVTIGETPLRYDAILAEKMPAEVDEFEDLVGTAPLVGSGLGSGMGSGESHHELPLPVEAGEPLSLSRVVTPSEHSDPLHAHEADFDIDADLDNGLADITPGDTVAIPALVDEKQTNAGKSHSDRIPITAESDEADAVKPQMLIGENLIGEKLSSSGTGTEMQAAAREAMELARSAEQRHSIRPVAPAPIPVADEAPIGVDELPLEEIAIDETPPVEAVTATPIVHGLEAFAPEQPTAVEEDWSVSEVETIDEVLPPEEVVVEETAAEAEWEPVAEEVPPLEFADAIAPVAEVPVVEEEAAVQELPTESAAEKPQKRRGWFGWGKRREEEELSKPAVERPRMADQFAEPQLLDETVELPSEESIAPTPIAPVFDATLEAVTEVPEESTADELTEDEFADVYDSPPSRAVATYSSSSRDLADDEESADLNDLYPIEPRVEEAVVEIAPVAETNAVTPVVEPVASVEVEPLPELEWELPVESAKEADAPTEEVVNTAAVAESHVTPTEVEIESTAIAEIKAEAPVEAHFVPETIAPEVYSSVTETSDDLDLPAEDVEPLVTEAAEDVPFEPTIEEPLIENFVEISATPVIEEPVAAAEVSNEPVSEEPIHKEPVIKHFVEIAAVHVAEEQVAAAEVSVSPFVENFVEIPTTQVVEEPIAVSKPEIVADTPPVKTEESFAELENIAEPAAPVEAEAELFFGDESLDEIIRVEDHRDPEILEFDQASRSTPQAIAEPMAIEPSAPQTLPEVESGKADISTSEAAWVAAAEAMETRTHSADFAEPALEEPIAERVEVVESTEPTRESALPLEIIEETAFDLSPRETAIAAESQEPDLGLSDTSFGRQVDEFAGEAIAAPILDAPVELPAVVVEVKEEAPVIVEHWIDEPAKVADEIHAVEHVENTGAVTVDEVLVEEVFETIEAPQVEAPELVTNDAMTAEPIEEFVADEELPTEVGATPAMEVTEATAPVEMFEAVEDLTPLLAEMPIEIEAQPIAASPDLAGDDALPEFDDLEIGEHSLPAPETSEAQEFYETLPTEEGTANEAVAEADAELEPEQGSFEAMQIPGMSLFGAGSSVPDFIGGLPLMLNELAPPPPTFGRVQVSFGQDEPARPLLDDPREPSPFDRINAQAAREVEAEAPMEIELPAETDTVEDDFEVVEDVAAPTVIEEAAPGVEAEPEPVAEELPPVKSLFQNKLRVPPVRRKLEQPLPEAPAADSESAQSFGDAPAGFGQVNAFGGLNAPASGADLFAQGMSADLSNDPFLGGAVKPLAQPAASSTAGRGKIREPRKPKLPVPIDAETVEAAGKLADDLGLPERSPKRTAGVPASLKSERAARADGAAKGRNGLTSLAPVSALTIADAVAQRPSAYVPSASPSKRRRGRRVGVLLFTMVVLMIATFAAIYTFMKQRVTVQGSIGFENFGKLNIAEQRSLQIGQNVLMTSEELRTVAINNFTHDNPKSSLGYLGDRLDFKKNEIGSRVKWLPTGTMVYTYEGTDKSDVERVRAVLKALRAMDADLVSDADKNRQAILNLRGTLDQKMKDLESKKVLRDQAQKVVERQPAEDQIKALTADKEAAEKVWKQAVSAVNIADAELQRIEQASSTASTGEGVESLGSTVKSTSTGDPELDGLQKNLEQASARLNVARNTVAEKAESARNALDTALEQFQQSTNVVQGIMKDNPELSAFVVAAQRLQETLQRLSGDLLDRQQKSYEHLLEEKRYLDERLTARRKELWDADKDIKRLKDDLGMRERGYNAALTNDYPKEAADIKKQMDASLGTIERRKMEIENDPILVTLNEFSAKRQQEITASHKLLETDRKKADELTKEIEKNLSQHAPTVEKLPENQRALAQQMTSKMDAVSNARKVYAEALEAKNAEANLSLKLAEEQVQLNTTKVEDRKKAVVAMNSQEMTVAERKERETFVERKRATFDVMKKRETDSYNVYFEKEKAARMAASEVTNALKTRDEFTQLTDAYFNLRAEIPALKNQLEMMERDSGAFAYPTEPKVNEPTAAADQRLIYSLGSMAAIALVFSLLFALTGGRDSHSGYPGLQEAHLFAPPEHDVDPLSGVGLLNPETLYSHDEPAHADRESAVA